MMYRVEECFAIGIVLILFCFLLFQTCGSFFRTRDVMKNNEICEIYDKQDEKVVKEKENEKEKEKDKKMVLAEKKDDEKKQNETKMKNICLERKSKTDAYKKEIEQKRDIIEQQIWKDTVVQKREKRELKIWQTLSNKLT